MALQCHFHLLRLVHDRQSRLFTSALPYKERQFLWFMLRHLLQDFSSQISEVISWFTTFEDITSLSGS